MAKLYSPSDYTSKDATISYSTGEGYYTNVGLVAGLLQIPEFTGSTNPTEGDVGEYIKRVEDYIDEKTGISYRPIIYKDEVHNFKFTGFQHDYELTGVTQSNIVDVYATVEEPAELPF